MKTLRLATQLWLEAAAFHVSSGGETAERTRDLVVLGFVALDALHLAFAENSKARWFLTTDDRLPKRARTHRDRLRAEVLTPEQLPLLSEREER